MFPHRIKRGICNRVTIIFEVYLMLREFAWFVRIHVVMIIINFIIVSECQFVFTFIVRYGLEMNLNI